MTIYEGVTSVGERNADRQGKLTSPLWHYWFSDFGSVTNL